MTFFKGWLYCALWYSSILAGYSLLFCPLLPLLFISNKLYRYITDIFFTFWQYYPTALLEIICDSHVQVTGDAIRTGELSLLLMNHRTRTDWNFFWPTVYHCVEGKGKLAHSTKFILKDQIRHIPGPGWIMQLACFVYIQRCWQMDRLILKKYVEYVSDINYKHSLLIFPEGTDLTEATKKNSDKFAIKNDLPLYDNVLHPKTTGFVYLTQQLLYRNSLDAVYDITLIYPDTIPQNEKWLLNGKFPNVVKIHLVRYPKSVLPTSEEGLKQFLEKRWFDKEKIIKEFQATGNFLHGQILQCKRKWELYLAFIFWTILPYISLYLFLTNNWFMAIVIVHTLFLLGVNMYCKGFQNFEILLHMWKKHVYSINEKPN
ncbi:lysocardiolipin acyltransferase 1-like [Diorhabda carinulata]|uniref:lysocardiolipin acyltransferase 1-like n=1 Tax=Diorhabda carinulata TaxID=1163345 RepID=UPI0025A268A4|nr:lysocardiolipin acyltransferase 1-like [Diorhabda carinulata]XP_057664477.1 lysocardiolipin acyltransferase 1-like [Diorhabda carinulata]